MTKGIKGFDKIKQLCNGKIEVYSKMEASEPLDDDQATKRKFYTTIKALTRKSSQRFEVDETGNSADESCEKCNLREGIFDLRTKLAEISPVEREDLDRMLSSEQGGVSLSAQATDSVKQLARSLLTALKKNLRNPDAAQVCLQTLKDLSANISSYVDEVQDTFVKGKTWLNGELLQKQRPLLLI